MWQISSPEMRYLLEPKVISIIIFLFVGLFEILLSLPLILEKVPPNYFYGFRTQKTLSDKEIWYRANRYNGKDMLVAGLMLLVGALLLFLLKEKLSFIIINWIGIALILIPIFIVLFRGFRYLKKL